MKRKIVTLTTLLCISASLIACSGSKPEPVETTAPTNTPIATHAPTATPKITVAPATVAPTVSPAKTVAVPAYEVATSETYGTAGEQGHSFRIVLSSKSVTDDELKAIYNDLKASSYREATIWFYSSKSATNGMYDIAMLEGKGSSITITRR